MIDEDEDEEAVGVTCRLCRLSTVRHPFVNEPRDARAVGLLRTIPI